MLSQHFFHPDHVPPLVQLVAAPGEMAHGFVTQLFMKGNAARVGVGDACIDIQHILFFQCLLQGFIEGGSGSGASCVLRDIDRSLHSPVIGGPLFKCGGIGVSDDLPVSLCNQIGVAVKGVGDPCLKLPGLGTVYSKVTAVFST